MPAPILPSSKCLSRLQLAGTVLLAAWLLVSNVLPAQAERGAVRAIHFDGAGAQLVVDHDPQLAPVGAMTIELWIRRDSITPACETLVSKGPDNGGYRLDICNNSLRFQPAGASSAKEGTYPVPSNRWSHVAVSYDNSTLRFYINGILRDEFDAPGPLGTNDNDLTLGANADQSAGYAGQMAQVRLWRSVRTQAEIRRHMTTAWSEDEPNLIGVWHLEGNHHDAFGRFATTPQHGPTYVDSDVDNPGAPIYSSAPLGIPRLPDQMTIDGVCLTGSNLVTTEYTFAMRLPLWYTDQNGTESFTWTYLGNDAQSIYLCARVDNIDLSYGSAGYVYLFPAGLTPPFRLRVTTATQEVEQLDPETGYQATNLDPNLYEAAYSGFSLDRTLEVELDRTLLGDGEFGLQLVHTVNLSDTGAAEDTAVFPMLMKEDFLALQPSTWPRFVLDDSTTGLPRADNARPTISFTLNPTSTARAGSPLVLKATATDDVDLARIDIRRGNGDLIRTCRLDGTDNTTATCEQTLGYPFGRYVFYVETVDHRGRYARSAARPFFYYLDNAPPEIFTARTPFKPARGEQTTFTVTGRDPSGIRRLELEAYIGTQRFAGGCATNDMRQTELDCTLTVDTGAVANGLFVFEATATDFEDYTTSSGRRFIPFDGPISDQDNDRLDDLFELYYCTDPTDPDSDGDGLLDGWELYGLDFANGDLVDLPQLGAHPCLRDIFLQLDYSAGRDMGPTYRQRFVNVYAQYGYTLHLSGKEHPAPPNGEASPVAEVAAASQDSNGDYYFAPRLNWTHRYGFIRDIPDRSGGGGAQDHYFSATSGRGGGADLTTYQVVFHELGHTLGLGHGGRREKGSQAQTSEGLVTYQGTSLGANRNPNYFSSMNYAYSYISSEVCFNPTTQRWLVDGGFLANDMPTLQEDTLNESAFGPFAQALGARPCSSSDPDYVPVVMFTCEHPTDTYPDGSAMRYRVLSSQLDIVARKNTAGSSWQTTNLPAQSGSGIDWNCNSVIDGTVTGAINEIIPKDACDGQGDDEGCGRRWSVDQTLEAKGDWDKLSPGRACTLVAPAREEWQQPNAYRNLVGGPDCADVRAQQVAQQAFHSLQPLAEPGEDLSDEDPVDPTLWNLPNLEFCDGVDNDGNGIIDDDCADGDADTVADAVDNCPHTPNADQSDADANWLGDACQTPVVDNLTMTVQSGGVVSLTWSVHNGYTGHTGHTDSAKIASGDLLGFAIYRQAGEAGDLRYLGNTYPSTTATGYQDTPPAGPIRYRVYPLNRAGANGVGASVGELPEPDAPTDPNMLHLPLLETAP